MIVVRTRFLDHDFFVGHKEAIKKQLVTDVNTLRLIQRLEQK